MVQAGAVLAFTEAFLDGGPVPEPGFQSDEVRVVGGDVGDDEADGPDVISGAGPYRKTSSCSPSVAPLITSGPSASSSPTSPPTTRTSSDWKPGSGTGPPSRNASVKASTAPA